ncbi:MAG: hypothetical protein HIU88_10270 [Acidobacteria bacterium]|nr:hypothetical protein [Acidobacteriota bacterium]
MASRSALFVGLDGSGNGMTPGDGRRALGALFGTVARPLLQPSATLSSSNMQITVAQNVWQLPDPTDAASTFISPMDSFTVTPAAGPSSGSRIDSIVIKQDNPQNSDADPYSTPSLIAGTTSPPAIPAGYYEVARVTVPAGASNAAAATLAFMYPAGLAPLPLSVAGSSALASIAGTAAGERALLANGDEWRWNGTAWVPDRATAAPGYAGTAADFAASPNNSVVRRDGGSLELILNVNTGANGANTSTAALILGTPIGFRPAQTVRGILTAFPGSWNGSTIQVEWRTDGTLNVNYGSVAANGGLFGSISAIAA